MIAGIIELNRDGIVALGRKHRVRTLWVFGSVVTDAWDPETSDIDFLVDLGGYEPGVVDRYLDLADDLETLLGRQVDLVSVGGLRHRPRWRAELERTRVMLYERARTSSRCQRVAPRRGARGRGARQVQTIGAGDTEPARPRRERAHQL